LFFINVKLIIDTDTYTNILTSKILISPSAKTQSHLCGFFKHLASFAIRPQLSGSATSGNASCQNAAKRVKMHNAIGSWKARAAPVVIGRTAA
jgi:hypothetical protein